MSKDALKKTRNIGIVAHIDAGKTTTTERVLFLTGTTSRVGEVDDGTTVTDWMKQERERGITITAASVSCAWAGHKVNIIDTPGHVDFTLEVERCLRVLDGAVVVFCGVGGVEPQSETVWRQADKFSVPKVVFVNKMDRVGASFARVLRDIQAKLGARPVVVALPDAEGPAFGGVVDVVEERYLRFDEAAPGARPVAGPVPAALADETARARKALLEAVADADEAALEEYLAAETVAAPRVREVLRRLTIEGKAVPVLAGSALKGKGIEPLLDAVVAYLPSPLDVPPVVGVGLDGVTPEKRQPNPQLPFSALAFKIQDDPFAGQLTYLRVYSGTLRVQEAVLNASRGKREKIGRLLHMYANRREEIASATAGEIVAAIGLRQTRTGDTLCDPGRPLLLGTIDFPEPVVFVAVEPKLKADEPRLEEALARIGNEDPSFHHRTDPETGQRIMGGMGELHLEVITTRIVDDYRVPVIVGKPQVALRETATRAARAEHLFDKVIGGHAHFARLAVEVGPAGRGRGFVFEDRWAGPGAPPAALMAAVAESLREGLGGGVLAGYQVTDVKVAVTGGEHREQASTEMAFRAAAVIALKDALREAACALMEPVMSMEILTPKDSVGDVIGDFHSRGGKVADMELKGETQVVRGTIPLRSTFGYATTIRSLTQGRAAYTMQFLRFEPIAHGPSA